MRYLRARHGGEIARSGCREITPWACRAAGPKAHPVRPGEPRRLARLALPPKGKRRAPPETFARADAAGPRAAVLESVRTCRRRAAENASSRDETAPST